MKEEVLSSSEKDIKQSPLKSVVDYNKLFFSVFSVLQKLGADDRPEVLFLSTLFVLCINTYDLWNIF